MVNSQSRMTTGTPCFQKQSKQGSGADATAIDDKDQMFSAMWSSDVVQVRAFGTSMNIHRHILEQIPYFQMMFARWNYDCEEEILFSDIITKDVFELVLKRLYLGKPVKYLDLMQFAKASDLARYLLLDNLSIEFSDQIVKNAKKEDIAFLKQESKRLPQFEYLKDVIAKIEGTCSLDREHFHRLLLSAGRNCNHRSQEIVDRCVKHWLLLKP